MIKYTVTQPSQHLLNEVIRRIVAVADPESVILFGSAARGTVTEDSDLDLLVVKAGANRQQLAHAIYRNLFGVGQAVDVVVVRPEDVARYQHIPQLVIENALREGQVVYERKT